MVAPITPRQASQRALGGVQQHEPVLRVTKQVRFPAKSSSLRNIRSTLHLKDYTSEERFNSFYDNEEWHDMKVNVSELLSLLENGNIDARDACIRGLDKLYGERQKMVRIVRAQVVDAVMDAQEVVWDKGMDNDWDVLANASRAITINADREAIQTAWDDMESAKQAYSRKFLATCPRGGREPSQQPCHGVGPQAILKRSEPCTLPPSSFLLKEPKRTRSNSQSIRTIRTVLERQKTPSGRRRDSSSTTQTKSTTLTDSSRRSRRSVDSGGQDDESVTNDPQSQRPRQRSGSSDVAMDPSTKPRRRSDPGPVQVGNDPSLTTTPVTRNSTGCTSSSTATTSRPPSPRVNPPGPISDTHNKKTTAIHRGDRPTSNPVSMIPSSPKSTDVRQSTTTKDIHTRSPVSPKPNGRLMVLHSPSPQSKPREDDGSSPRSVTDQYCKQTTLPRSPFPSEVFTGSRRTLSLAASVCLPPGPCLVDAASFSSRRTKDQTCTV